MSQTEDTPTALAAVDAPALARGLAAGTPIPSSAWQQIAEQCLLGVQLPEAVGGAGQDADAELAKVTRLATGGMPGPLVSTIVAALVCQRVGFGYLRRQLVAGHRTAGWLSTDGRLVVDARAVAPDATALAVSVSQDEVRVHELTAALAPADVPGTPMTLDRVLGDTPPLLETPDGVGVVEDAALADRARRLLRTHRAADSDRMLRS